MPKNKEVKESDFAVLPVFLKPDSNPTGRVKIGVEHDTVKNLAYQKVEREKEQLRRQRELHESKADTTRQAAQMRAYFDRIDKKRQQNELLRDLQQQVSEAQSRHASLANPISPLSTTAGLTAKSIIPIEPDNAAALRRIESERLRAGLHGQMKSKEVQKEVQRNVKDYEDQFFMQSLNNQFSEERRRRKVKQTQDAKLLRQEWDKQVAANRARRDMS